MLENLQDLIFLTQKTRIIFSLTEFVQKCRLFYFQTWFWNWIREQRMFCRMHLLNDIKSRKKEMMKGMSRPSTDP